MSAAKPFLRFHHSVALRTRIDRLIAQITQDDDPTVHVGALSELIMDLTEAGFDAFFLQPLRRARFGAVAQRTAAFGMGTALRVMAPMVRTILSGADAAQLRSIARQMEGFRSERPGAGRGATSSAAG